ncbi:efflux transporter outer membrane subunit [Photobacterium aphoticum]|uniref:efflux transporter outer membrane subunit n=1 Tax=Photobacterium aphoticum TaxID=754436 RepID=UPI0009E1D77D|nr:TolC family protein [Photobacterium aphoticum]PSU58742.1 TolC family protein [Photobacterium aphoticum]GHA32324.1 multidrug transporter [Photobacterium aphoticum]
MTNLSGVALSIAVAISAAGCVNFIPDYERGALPVEQDWPVQPNATNSANYSIYTATNNTSSTSPLVLSSEAVPGRYPATQTQSQTQTQARTSPVAPKAVTVEQDWRLFVQNPKIQQVVELALDNNRDVRIALLNIQRAEALFGIQRANRLPNIDATAGAANQRIPENANNGNSTISRQYSVDLGITSYEIDFWGRIASLEQQALEQYLATIEARKNTQLSLVSSVIEAYLTLLADQYLLQLAKDTLTLQQDSLNLTQKSLNSGVATGLDVAQAQTTVATALKDVARFTSQVNVDINALTTLVGTRIPTDLLPKQAEQIQFAPIQVGMPSTVLLRRPDILALEHQLIGANANIGAARAAYFPAISLTATGGLLSASADDLFSDDSLSWTFTPTLVLPIFRWGELDAQLDVARADQQIALNQYEKAIQTAFREVADALANQATLKDQVAAQQMLVDATGESFRLSNLRFDEGVDDYFTVLDSQRSFYTAQQELINTKLSEQLNFLTLYKVLGGGWVTSDVSPPASKGYVSQDEQPDTSTETSASTYTNNNN